MSDEMNQLQAALSPEEIAALIRLHRLQPTAVSPLRSFITTDGGVTQSDLKQRGLHRAVWRDALGVLAAPERQVRAQIPAPAESFTVIYYGRSPDNHLVGCWLEEDGLQVSFPWAEDQILAMGWQVLLATVPPPADDWSLTLGLPGLTALVAAVDGLRALLFRSYLYRETNVPLLLTHAGLFEQLELGLTMADGRWLVSLLNLAGSPHFPLVPQSLAAGIAELVAAGLFVVDGEGWQPSTGLQRLALQWRSPLPAFALESLVVDRDNRLHQYGHRLIIRGDGPLWQIDFGAAVWQAEPQVTVSGVDPRHCFDGLAQLVAVPTAVPSRPQPTAEATLVDESVQTMVGTHPVPTHLIVRAGGLMGQQFPLGPMVSLGRNPDNAIHLDDQQVSRHHAQIIAENGRYFLEDLGSSNGTLVNGQRLSQKTMIKIGDQITIGSTLFELIGQTQSQPMTAEKQCPTCHRPVPPTARFCRTCGSVLS